MGIRDCCRRPVFDGCDATGIKYLLDGASKDPSHSQTIYAGTPHRNEREKVTRISTSAKGNELSKVWLHTGWLTLTLVVAVLLTPTTAAGAGNRQTGFSLGDNQNQKVRVCPPAKEISPCLCSVISKGKANTLLQILYICMHYEPHTVNVTYKL